MFEKNQKVVVVSGGDATRVKQVQWDTGQADQHRSPTVYADGATGRDQQVQVLAGGDATRVPKLVPEAAAFIQSLSPVAWFREGVGITITGAGVAVWADQSGNGNDLLQGTDTNRPAYSAGVVTFDGVDNYLKAAAFTLVQPTTIVLVVKQNTWVLNEVICDGNGAAGGAIQQAATTPGIVINAGAQAAENSDLAVGSFGIVCAVINGSASSIRVNAGAAATGNPSTGNMGGFTLGATGTPSNYGACSVREAILFPSALTDVQQLGVVSALNNKMRVF